MTDALLGQSSPRRLARIAGICAVVGIVTGAFDIGYVRSVLFVAADAAATARNILAHETLFRAGFGAHLLLLLCNIPAEIIFFVLFRRVNLVVAAVAMACGLIGTAIESLDMLNSYVPLQLAIDVHAMGTFTPQQIESTSYLALQLQNVGLLISFVFYGLDEMLGGFLIVRSGFIPRAIGALLGIAGLCYFAHGFLSVLAPGFDARLYPYILYPCLPGEGSTAIWMATAGINVARWTAWTASRRPAIAEPLLAT
jgi:hypothetical protein